MKMLVGCSLELLLGIEGCISMTLKAKKLQCLKAIEATKCNVESNVMLAVNTKIIIKNSIVSFFLY